MVIANPATSVYYLFEKIRFLNCTMYIKAFHNIILFKDYVIFKTKSCQNRNLKLLLIAVWIYT